MVGETDLHLLLRSMQPELLPDEFAFCTQLSSTTLAAVNPIMTFQETEGVTAIIRMADVSRLKLPFQYRCRQITLHVHSSLEAIGFLAVITSRLAELGISMNAVSAYFHDHLFVASDRAEDAYKALTELCGGRR